MVAFRISGNSFFRRLIENSEKKGVLKSLLYYKFDLSLVILEDIPIVKNLLNKIFKIKRKIL
jgi:hypothetical protein